MPDPRKLWGSSGKPPKWVSDRLGIKRWQLRTAIHKIKRRNGMDPTDDVNIWSDGSVTDWRGEWLGDIKDAL